MEEGELEVDRLLVRRERQRSHGDGDLVEAGVVERLSHVVATLDLVGLRVHDLQHPLALERVGHVGVVERAVDRADAGMQDALAAVDEEVLVRGPTRAELSDLLAVLDPQHMDDVAGRGADDDAPAVRGDGHVVGADAVDLEAPDDLLGLQADRHDVGEGRPGDHHQATVVGGVHVVDELVVALADQRADGEEVGQPVGVGRDLLHPLVVVGHDVDAPEPRERTRRHEIGGAVPVVADEDHSPGALRAVSGRAGVAIGERHRPADVDPVDRGLCSR
ncbi:hypothetical protein BH09ACT12_BH09ACT12_05110 [soil metagenome]